MAQRQVHLHHTTHYHPYTIFFLQMIIYCYVFTGHGTQRQVQHTYLMQRTTPCCIFTGCGALRQVHKYTTPIHPTTIPPHPHQHHHPDPHTNLFLQMIVYCSVFTGHGAQGQVQENTEEQEHCANKQRLHVPCQMAHGRRRAGF